MQNKLKYVIFSLSLLVLVACRDRWTNSKATAKTGNTASIEIFPYGVASGDPNDTSVIIWTKPLIQSNKDMKVKWEISKDSLFTKVIKNGRVQARAEDDFTVKQKIDGLAANTYYWYRFFVNSIESPRGRTKTLPVGNASLNLIAISCNSFEGGYFNAYEVIGKRADTIDAIVHLGDYIYEDFLPQYISKEDRIPEPEKRLITLEDYRKRYAQYRLDKKLQLAHQKHPFINIWDDHEIANDAYVDGALGHQEKKDGSYESRKSAAKKAFYEWLPIVDDGTHYRSFSLGQTAELFMLDGRLDGRTEQLSKNDEGYSGESRSILGKRQLKWLKEGLKTSKAKWKLLGNPVLFADFDFSAVQKNSDNHKLDRWSGYPYERKRVKNFIQNNHIEDVIFLSGDSHCSWVFDIQDEATKTTTLALEIGVPSVSSDNWDASFAKDTVLGWERTLYRNPKNKHLKYVNLRDHGYVDVKLSPSIAAFTWYYIDKDHKNYTVTKGPSYKIGK